MMSQSWLSIIGPLLGVIIGGLITLFISYIQFGYNKKIKDQELLLQRLEELNELIEDMCAVYNKLFWEAMEYHKKGVKIEIIVRKPMRLIRLKTLIYFYFSELNHYIDLLEETTEIFTTIILSLNNPGKHLQEKKFIVLIKTKTLFEKISKSILYNSSLIAKNVIK